MQFLVPAAAAAFVAVPAIMLLYFLKVRGPESRVSGLFLWSSHRIDRQANNPWKRLRLSRLLLAQLLVAAAVALALMRPGFAADTKPAGTTVVLIDGSASMRATDVKPSRFESAVGRARSLAAGLGPGEQMAVAVMNRHVQLLSPATNDRAALSAALDSAQPGGDAGNLEEGVSLANAILAGRSDGSVVMFSDGHSVRPTSPPRLAAPIRYETVGKSSENVALEAVGRTPEGDVFVRATNYGTAARDLRIQMVADGSLVDVLSVRIEQNASAEPIWTRLPAGTQILEARLVPGDEFDVDDTAWLVTAPLAPLRVQLVTASGEGFLARALAVREDLDVTITEPGAYKPGPYDLYVFDRFLPPGALPEPALVIAPPEGQGPLPTGSQIDPGGVLPADPREPILQYVSLRDVHVQSMAQVEAPPGWRTVVAATNGPLVVVRQGDGRVAQVNFDIHRSDLPLRPAFPVLIQNLVSHLVPGAPESEAVPLGAPVQVAGGPDVESVEVSTPSGATVELSPPFPATLSETQEPGVYTVRKVGPGEPVTDRFVAQLQDPFQSRIAPGEQPLLRITARSGGESEKTTREIWPWLVALALVAVMVESVVFLRG